MMTRKIKETYSFIRKYILDNGISPTEREIASGINIVSRGVAHRYVVSLEKLGLIVRVKNKRRNIKMVINVTHQDLIVYLSMISFLGPEE